MQHKVHVHFRLGNRELLFTSLSLAMAMLVTIRKILLAVKLWHCKIMWFEFALVLIVSQAAQDQPCSPEFCSMQH